MELRTIVRFCSRRFAILCFINRSVFVFPLFRANGVLTFLLLSYTPILVADESKSTESLTSTIRNSLVTIRVGDRNGGDLAMGTGFVVDESGLIATNLHVIREGRPINVELWPNKQLEVVAIEATSRGDDLALIRVAPGSNKLKPIPLGDSTIIPQGAEVLAFGNPLGLKHSVVQGLVSAIRDIDAREMIQVAMPIEPGNSGGPLVDRDGMVRGIINMKSLKAENVGFAIPVGRLRELMKATNPVVIDRWVRLSGVDPARWKPQLGAQWRERSGVIDVNGVGAGFGGRSLCLYQPPVPGDTFEISVQVKLDHEAGAAGLVFHADGKDKHYGFYPSNGSLRLTCFQGPTVYAWEIISEVPSKHYLPGQWNYLKVRVRPALIQCFVNGEMVIESKHDGLERGQVGLAKFRDTKAEFRQFRVAERIEDDELSERGRKWFEQLPDLRVLKGSNDRESIELLSQSSEASARELLRQAQQLNRQAERMKRLADDVRIAPILERFGKLFETEEASDLLLGSLLIASLDHPDLDVEAYQRRVDSMVTEITKQFPDKPTEEQKLRALDHYLFQENGFHGGSDEYYHEANNHMDRVIDDREGMPITLSLLYIELGRRLDLNIEGVGLPGHFVVRFRDSDDKTHIIDVHDKARRMTDDEVATIIARGSPRLVTMTEALRTQQPIEILVRILHNLLRSAERTGNFQSMRRYAEGLVALKSEEPDYHLTRGIVRYQTGRMQGALQDFDWLVKAQPPDIDIERVRQMRERVQRDIETE